MVILGSLDPHYFNHSRHVFIEIDFVENNSNSQIIACFVMCSLSLNLHFPHPISYATYWGLAHPTLSQFYKLESMDTVVGLPCSYPTPSVTAACGYGNHASCRRQISINLPERDKN